MLNWQQQFDAVDFFSPPLALEGTRSQHGVMGTERKETVDKGREGGGDVCLRGLVGLPAVAFPTSKRGTEGLDERIEKGGTASAWSERMSG